MSRRKPPTSSLEAQMLAVARGSQAPADFADDDCELCRMLAEEGNEPIEILTLPDGSTVEVRPVSAATAAKLSRQMARVDGNSG